MTANQIGEWTKVTLDKRRKDSTFFGAKNLRWTSTILLYYEDNEKLVESNTYGTSTNKRYMWLKDSEAQPHVIDFENSGADNTFFLQYCDNGTLEDIFDDNFHVLFSKEDRKITFVKDGKTVREFIVYNYIDVPNNINEFCHEREIFKYMFVEIDEENDGLLVFRDNAIQIIKFQKTIRIGDEEFKRLFMKFGINMITTDENVIRIKSSYSGTIGREYIFNIAAQKKDEYSPFEEITLNAEHENQDQDSHLAIDGGSKKTYHSISSCLSLGLISVNMMGPSMQNLHLLLNKVKKEGTFYSYESENWELPLTSFESSVVGNGTFFTFKKQDEFYQFSGKDFLESFAREAEKNDLYHMLYQDKEAYKKIQQEQRKEQKRNFDKLQKKLRFKKWAKKNYKTLFIVPLVILVLSPYYWKYLVMFKNQIQKKAASSSLSFSSKS